MAVRRALLASAVAGALAGFAVIGANLDAQVPESRAPRMVPVPDSEFTQPPANGITLTPLNYSTGFEPEQGFTARDFTCMQNPCASGEIGDGSGGTGYTGECGFIGDGTQGSGPYPEPWGVSSSNAGNIEGHVDTANPYSGTQHLRLSYDACDSSELYGFSVDARIPAGIPQPAPIAPITFSSQIALRHGLFGTNVTWYPVSSHQGLPLGIVRFDATGYFHIIDDPGTGITTAVLPVRWDETGGYRGFATHHDPCAHFICINNGYGDPLGVGPGSACPNGSSDCRQCVGGTNNGANCVGSFQCPGGTCMGGDCVGRIDYYYDVDGDGNLDLIYQGVTIAGTAGDEFVIYTDNQPGTLVDLDDLVIETGAPCPTECGNIEIERGEECDGINDYLCPGACVPPGQTGPNGEGECTCIREGTTCATATPLFNGTQSGGISHGGWWTFVADAPAYAIETCGTETHDTELFVYNGTCTSLELITSNNDCDDNTYGFGENADPLASCYAIGGIRSPYESCTCISTNIGQQYWVFEGRNGLGREAVMTLTKRLDCGAVWDNGACCDRLHGTCTDDVAPADCPGPQYAFTLNKLCSSSAVTCEAAPGMCCDYVPPVGVTCTNDVVLADCQGPYQTWTLEARCGDVPCEEPRGACCDALTGVCVNNVLPTNCQGKYKAWSKDALCSIAVCDDPIPGACCDMSNPDPLSRSGICTNGVIMPDCQGDSHTWTKGVTCAQVVCVADFQAIPTVSEWGIAMLALALLVVAKLWFGFARRPSISAA